MSTTRRALIGDAAITLLAERGMRGLTHRAVDAATGLSTGSTSYYARTRAALLELTVVRLTELDEADYIPHQPAVDGPAGLAELVARSLSDLLTRGRARTLARYELALEATRRPELRATYDRASSPIRWHAADLLTAAGSQEPHRHAWILTAWCDGILFDSLAGAGGTSPPSATELHNSAAELLGGMLD